MKRKTLMAETADMTIAEILQKLAANQAERQELLQALQPKITKKTEGGFGFSDDKSNAPKYWYQVAKDYADDLLPANFDLDDFGVKALNIEDIVSAQKTDDTISAELKMVRDAASQDAYWYVSFVIRRVKELKSNAVFKKILQNAPTIRVAKNSNNNNNNNPSPPDAPAKE
jgi:hypothetical protein